MSRTPSVTVRTVNFDCPDAQEMARFYGGLLGWEWPEEPGRQQKMLHLELLVTPPGADDEGRYSDEDGQAALEEAVRLALSVGGTLAEPQFRADLRVVLDPAGHPLCLFLL